MTKKEREAFDRALERNRIFLGWALEDHRDDRQAEALKKFLKAGVIQPTALHHLDLERIQRLYR